jgi:hypothetical protein
MKKIILIIMTCVTLITGANINVYPGDNLHNITNNAGDGDTIFVRNGPGLYVMSSTGTSTLNTRVVILSVNGNDIIEKPTSWYDCFTAGGDSITITGFYFRWTNVTGTGSPVAFFRSAGTYGGHKICNNSFVKPDAPRNARAIIMTRNNSSITLEPSIVRHNYFDSCHVFCADDFNTGANSITCDSNIFKNSRAKVGDKSTFRWNCSFKGGDFVFMGDSMLIEWNYGGSFWSGLPEYYGNDDNNHYARGCVVRYNYFDSIAHNTTWDGMMYSNFYNNTWRKCAYSIYNHNTAADSMVFTKFYENWISGTASGQFVRMSNGAASSDIRFTRNVFFGAAPLIFMGVSIIRDTLDSCFASGNPATDYFDTKIAFTANTPIQNYVIDTDKHQYLKQNIINPLVFSNGKKVTPKWYLTNIISEDSTSSSFSFACSLAVDFRYWNKVFTWINNSWFYGDTVQLTIQYTTDTLGSITSVAGDTLAAGEKSIVSINSLNSNQKYFYRVIGNGASWSSTQVHDTTLWNIVSTLEMTDTSHYDTMGIISDVDNRNAAAVIVIQPENDTVDAGYEASFILQASGSNLTYRWFRNYTNIESNTNYYSFITSGSNDGDSIWCKVVADTGDTAASNKVYLKVNVGTLH